MTSLYHAALGDLARVFDRIDQTAVTRAVDEIAAAKPSRFTAWAVKGCRSGGWPCACSILG
jgi:hypothetical protein